MAGVLWLASCPPLPSDTDVFTKFVKESCAMESASISLKTSSDREALGCAEAFVRVFSAKNIHVEYKWDSRHYEGRPLAHSYGPLVIGSSPFPPEDDSKFSGRIKAMVNPPSGTLLVLVSQVVMDKVAEIMEVAPGMAVCSIRKEASDKMFVKDAVSYQQFWEYNEKVRRERGETRPTLPYTGPLGELSAPVESVKEAIMGAIRDRVLDATDLPDLERHILVEVGKIAFDLQSRYKLSLSALWDGYDRLLQGVHATNDRLVDHMRVVRREQDGCMDMLEKIDDMMKTGPGEAEFHRDMELLRKQIVTYEKNNRAVQDLAFGLFGKTKRPTIILHGIRKAPGINNGLFEVEIENTRKKPVDGVDIVIIRGEFKQRLREPEMHEPGRKWVQVRINIPGKALIYASQNWVKVSEDIKLLVEDRDVPVPMEEKKRLFPKVDDEKVLPPAPSEPVAVAASSQQDAERAGNGVRASASMREFGKGPKARTVQVADGVNPFSLGGKGRGKLPPEQEAKVAEVQRTLQGDFTPAIRLELEELLQTPKGKSLTPTALLDLLIKL